MPKPDRTAERPEDDEELLDQAWEALEDDDPEEALALARRIDPRQPMRFVVEGAALHDLDDIEGVRASVKSAETLGAPKDDIDLMWLKGEIALRAWQLREAEQLFKRVEKKERFPGVLTRLALCAELRGDMTRADELFRAADQLDPEGAPLPERLTQDEFESVIDEAVKLLPEPFQKALENTSIVVAPVPSIEMVRDGDLDETPPDILGLFVGRSLLEQSDEAPGELPPTIYLFQRNLERSVADRDELCDEIRITLYHEIGHMLGFDEEGVERMGLE